MVKFATSRAKAREKSRAFIPSVDIIKEDKITQLAGKYWASYTKAEHLEFDQKIVDDLYINDIVQSSSHSARRIALLEISQYLENYLWPNFNPVSSSFSHVMSIVCMVNEKYREGVPVWRAFETDKDKFGKLVTRVLKGLLQEGNLSLREACSLLLFLQVTFSSLEVDFVRKQVQGLVSLQIWHSLSEGRREDEFRHFPKWKKYWKSLLKKEEKEQDADVKELSKFQRTFFKNLITNFLDLLNTQDYLQEQLERDFLLFSERFMELMIDLQALLPTRRYLNVLIDDLHLIVKCQMSPLIEHGDGHLFSQLLDRLKFYSNFEICNESGDPLTEVEVMTQHYDKITSLQQTAFQKFPDLRQFALSNVNSVDSKAAIMKNFKGMSFDDLKELAVLINLLPKDASEVTEDFLLSALVFRYERRISQIKRLNSMALYPTEEMIWDENVVPSDYHSSSGQVLALPKLNLQFLTIHDYLLRNFELFRLESTYQIRQDVEDALFRLKPWRPEDSGDTVLFNGWARMAQPITRFQVVQVSKPNLGENKPSKVRADVEVNLNVRLGVKDEWENLRRHDACFLITVRPMNNQPMKYDMKSDFISQVGLLYVRGCEVEGMLDANGRIIEEGPEPRPHIPGDTRTFRMALDPNQYQMDLDNIAQGKEDIYETFNILLRRKPKENNFKAVLETIRDLMNINCVVPDWLHDVILGYGDPTSAHYSKLPNKLKRLDFNDTFINVEHALQSFPEYKAVVKGDVSGGERKQLRVTFEEEGEKVVTIEPYSTPSRGPYPTSQPNLNKIRFTPTQIEAIRSGMQPGLTVVVGPPGTGKTDIATQIISNIYHNFPEQRTLIVTHSNQALNQLFEKIIKLDVDERHLLRLGHGEEELETEKDFSRYGRVNYVLAKRLDLLGEVDKLKASMRVKGDVAYTCETSRFFYVHNVLPNWEAFLLKVKAGGEGEKAPALVSESFPFHAFFSDAPQPLFKGESFEKDLEVAEGCFRYIKRIFEQLDEFRAFELLRTGLDRARYLLVKEAKIIAMTCTHAALKRRELVDLIFQYDNILMEESAQILEIETFIPLLLQNPEDGRVRLKRWVLIGDHHQLPPVIKNPAFGKYGNMEQSLFSRFVRLGVPAVQLDAQGRARASIARLYQWRYSNLGNLPHIDSDSEYRGNRNPGFKFDYQLINVVDYNGVGESEPSPYFFQNLAEAEYVVATYMYMRLLGYPADKITILTTYNGQKALIKDIIQAKCASVPFLGEPAKISTVDKYQGQQNDYILLSLVRTKRVGHLRDVRRLVVALSRARLGLYIFARIPLFSNCFELTPAFSILTSRSSQMELCPSDPFPLPLGAEALKPPEDTLVIKDMPQMAQFVFDRYIQRIQRLKETEEREKQEKLVIEMKLREEVAKTRVKKDENEIVPISFEEEENMEMSTAENKPEEEEKMDTA